MSAASTLADRQRAMRERNVPVKVCNVPGAAAFEQHYTPAALAKLWGLSPRQVLRIFVDEPGVLRLGERGALRRAIRIPQNVVERKHREMATK